MAQYVYPCVCGAVCDTYGRMQHHRRACTLWKGRSDAKQLTQQRRATHRKKVAPARCPACGERTGHHIAGCFHSFEESSRRELLERFGIPLDWFGLFLKVLARRYEKRKP